MPAHPLHTIAVPVDRLCKLAKAVVLAVAEVASLYLFLVVVVVAGVLVVGRWLLWRW